MEKTKILIVEDETIIALDIKRALEKMDYEVTNMVYDYQGAIKSVKINRPDLILMDVNLGNSKDGIETAKEIKNYHDIPIIYLTAFSDEQTINRAIETNPVRYLIKPFKREELKSNILLGLNKSKTKNEELYENKALVHIGEDYYFDIQKSKLYLNKMNITLGSKEELLLQLLLESKGEIVPFSHIEYMIWRTNSINHTTLKTLIYRLRTKLDYKFIETVQSVGCKIC